MHPCLYGNVINKAKKFKSDPSKLVKYGENLIYTKLKAVIQQL